MVIFLGLIFPILGRQIYANDSFKALYTGRYISLFQQFAHHSTYTFNSTLDFLPRDAYNWLGNLVLLGFFKIGGLIGLQLFRNFLLLFFLVGILALIRWKFNPLTLLLLFFLSYGLDQKLLVRTAIFSIPYSTCLFLGWAGYALNEDKRWLWSIPPILILWSNSHGSYLVGVSITAVLVGSEIIDHIVRKDDIKRAPLTLISIMVISLLGVTAVKPFPTGKPYLKFSNNFLSLIDASEKKSNQNTSPIGTHALGRPGDIPEISSKTDFDLSKNSQNQPSRNKNSILKTLKNHLQSIIFPEQNFRSSEFGSPLFHTSQLMVRLNMFFVALAFLTGLISANGRFSFFLPFFALMVLSMGYLRTVGYASLILIPLAIIEFRRGGDFSVFKTANYTNVLFCAFIVIGLLTGNILSLIYTGTLQNLTGIRAHKIGSGTVEKFSQPVSEWVLMRKKEKKFFNSYNIGAYLIWQWWPHKKVFVDSKWSAYHPTFQKYYAETKLTDILSERKINHAIAEKNIYWTLYFISSDNWNVLKTDRNVYAYEHVQNF